MRGAALALLSVAVVVAGCGALSAEEKRAKRADYVRKADAACATLLTQLNSVHQERSFVSLATYLESSEKTVGDTAKRLHDLHGKLGDAKSAQIDAFDHRIDPARAATKALHAIVTPLVLHASARQAHAISVAAERTRRAYDGLYRAARRVKLRSCGRGGNRLADNALYAPYRDRVFAVFAEATRGRRRVNLNGNRTHDRASVVHDVRGRLAAFRRVSRLDPPSTLRRAHRRYVHAAQAELHLKRRMNMLLAQAFPYTPAFDALIDKINKAIHRVNVRSRPLFAALDLAGDR